MLDVKLKLKAGHTSERAWMESSPLKTLFWNVTYACNFRCGICFTDAGQSLPGELTAREALEAVDRIHAAGIRDVLISGGEPFARPDLVDILERMARFDIVTRIASNGSLLDDVLLRRLRERALVRSFQISLDTVDPEIYAEVHGTEPGMLDKVLANVDLIREHGFHTTTSVRLTPRSLPGIPDLLDMAVRRDWATVTVHLPVHTRRVKDAFPQDADVFSLLEPVFDYFCALPRKWLVETYIPWAEYHPAVRRLEKRIKVVHRGCRAGRDRLTIHPTGALSPCVCMDVPGAYYGNIRDIDLREAFRDSPVCSILRDPRTLGICSDCGNSERCGAGCRAAALALGGRIDAEDRSCPVRQALAGRKTVTAK
jgi:radical SAM protein with 4Fe4S-binding SPASM domain